MKETENTPESAFVALPALPGGSRARHRLTKTGAGLILSGGVAKGQAFSSLLIFNAKVGRFEELPVSLEDARFAHGAVALPGPDGKLGNADDALLIIGGFQGKRALSSVELIQPDPNGDGRWNDARIETLESLPFGLADHESCLAMFPKNDSEGSAVLLTGGLASAREHSFESEPINHENELAITSSSLLYHVHYGSDGRGLGEVEVPAQPAFARRGHTMTLLAGSDERLGTLDDQILVFGGVGYTSSSFSKVHALKAIRNPEIYEPGRNAWTTVTQLGDLELERGRTRHRALVTPHGILIAGGATDDGPIKDCLWLHIDPNQPSLAEIEFAGRLEQAREHPEMALVNDRVFVVGGFSEALETPLASVESMNLAEAHAEFVKLDTTLNIARVFHAMAHYDKRLIITGGFTSKGQFEQPHAEYYAEAQRKPE